MLVLGDGMADWLAYGLEDAYTERPDMGVIRKHRTASGLIRYQPKGDPADWTAAAKGILATEKPDAIVVMLGMQRPRRDARTGGGKEGRQEKGRQEGRRASRTQNPRTSLPPNRTAAADTAAKPDDKPAAMPRPMPPTPPMRRRSSRRNEARARAAV